LVQTEETLASISADNGTPTMRYVLLTLFSVFPGLTSVEAWAVGIKLDSREYKLMLAPGKFADDEAGRSVDHFWDEALKPIIAGLDTRENGRPRFKKDFKLDKERHVLFRDTEKCLLAL
jgi:hypothetical protein